MTATNGKGWEVQLYTNTFGWVPDGVTWTTSAEAKEDLASRVWDRFERRVYEVLEK